MQKLDNVLEIEISLDEDGLFITQINHDFTKETIWIGLQQIKLFMSILNDEIRNING